MFFVAENEIYVLLQGNPAHPARGFARVPACMLGLVLRNGAAKMTGEFTRFLLLFSALQKSEYGSTSKCFFVRHNGNAVLKECIVGVTDCNHFYGSEYQVPGGKKKTVKAACWHWHAGIPSFPREF